MTEQRPHAKSFLFQDRPPAPITGPATRNKHWLNPSDVPVFDMRRVKRGPKVVRDLDPPILLFTNRLGMSPPREIVTARVLGDPAPGRREKLVALQAAEEAEARQRLLAQASGVFARLECRK